MRCAGRFSVGPIISRKFEDHAPEEEAVTAGRLVRGCHIRLRVGRNRGH